MPFKALAIFGSALNRVCSARNFTAKVMPLITLGARVDENCKFALRA